LARTRKTSKIASGTNDFTTMSQPHIKLWDHVGLGIILSWPTGIIYSNQTGGTSCLAPEMEGAFIPLQNDCTLPDNVLLSPAKDLWDYFTGPRWNGTGATNGLEEADGNFIDDLLRKASLFPALRVDRTRLADSHEAWVHVIISSDESDDLPIFAGFTPYPRAGVLTWQNSD
jgi:hypothetical protein